MSATKSKKHAKEVIPIHKEIDISSLDVQELRSLAKKVQERIVFLLTNDASGKYVEFHENR